MEQFGVWIDDRKGPSSDGQGFESLDPGAATAWSRVARVRGHAGIHPREERSHRYRPVSSPETLCHASGTQA